MTQRPEYHQLLLLGLKIPQAQHTNPPPPWSQCLAVWIMRKWAWGKGINVLSWSSSGSDEQLDSWKRQLLPRRGHCATWRGSRWPTEGSAWLSAQSPSDGCCLLGVRAREAELSQRCCRTEARLPAPGGGSSKAGARKLLLWTGVRTKVD